MSRLREPRDQDPHARAGTAATVVDAGKSARTDDLSVQRRASTAAAPPQLGFAPPRAAVDDPFGLHLTGDVTVAPLQMKGAGKARRGDAANELLDELSDDDRARLQIATASSAHTPPLVMTGSQIDDLFPNEHGDITHEPQLDHVTIKLGSSIDEAWKDGLENIVGKLSASEPRTLLPNTTMTLVLDLRPHGGPLGTFRFTYVDRPDPKKKKRGKDEILVELVSTGGSDAITRDQASAGKQRFKAHGFTASGYARDEMEALCHAVALVPESALSKIAGVTFQRASAHAKNPAVGGEYDEAAHTVTMFDRAFAISVKIDTTTRDAPMRDLGARNVAADGTRSDESVRLIAHELGHAIDYAPVRARTKGATRASATDTRKTKVTAEFKDAVAADSKVPLTDYAETGWGEQYAEAFSFFVTDPALLRSLRPTVFAYFQTQFPST